MLLVYNLTMPVKYYCNNDAFKIKIYKIDEWILRYKNCRMEIIE